VDVKFRLSRTWGAGASEFTCPDSRTIVMHITEGEGTGSVAETHATPLGLGPDDAMNCGSALSSRAKNRGCATQLLTGR
jgi:hypothetical protein